MPTLASQLILTETAEILRNYTVSYNMQTQQLVYASIFDGVHEQANTIFLDGILSPPIHSLWLANMVNQVPEGYIYIDLIQNPCPVLAADLKYVFDIRSTDVEVMNNYLRANWELFSSLSSIQLIAAFCSTAFFTALAIPSSQRLWWQTTDLVQKKITQTTKVSVIQLCETL